eukprot:TRINITY_DN7681_c0_g1_i4.p1 TRINITY_DN7681_c0_g1~~TRINITY_DN7681_c0_g1_i4.p1  ORF type:complete len:569 (+),score=113.60 TRINITY_DN7681_c0_g1_i4:598-2304(+)
MLVDTTTDAETFEVIRQGLSAAVEVLPKAAYIGLISFGSSIVLHDMLSCLPHSIKIPIPAQQETSLDIANILSQKQLFVQIEEHRSKVQESVDGLQCSDSSKRGYGMALAALVDFLTEEPLFSEIRILSFLCGRPNHGLGSIPLASHSESDLHPSTTFYRDQALRAAKAGISIDLYLLANAAERCLGLSSLKYVAMTTGGNLNFYDVGSHASLAQDVFKHLSQDLAFHPKLRFRTSPAYAVTHHPNNVSMSLFPDESLPGLFALVGCAPQSCYAFDFEFKAPSGFASADFNASLQVAFSYSFLPRDKNKMSHRLRVCTFQAKVAANEEDIYRSAVPEVILTLLVAKLSRSIVEEGLQEARLLVQDWITILVSHYNRNITWNRKSSKVVEMSFTLHPHLLWLARFLFGLVKSPFMSQLHSPDADYWSYLHHLYTSLDPSLLRKCIYPSLSSYGSVNNMSSGDVVLSHTSVVTSRGRIFVVDAYSLLVVYYTDQASDQPFPPPKDSTIRSVIATIKQERAITPKIMYIQSQTTEAGIFEMLLVEEQNKMGGSFTQFLDQVKNQVIDLQKK